MGVRRHRPGPPRPMGSPEAAPGQPEPERRRRPRQRQPPGRARQLRSRPPAAAGCIHFRRRRGGGTASGARGLKGRASRRGGRCPPTERRPGGAACGGRRRAAGLAAGVPSEPTPLAGAVWGGGHPRGSRAVGAAPPGAAPDLGVSLGWTGRLAPGERPGRRGAPATSPLPECRTPRVGARGRGGCRHHPAPRTWRRRWAPGRGDPAPPRGFHGQGSWQQAAARGSLAAWGHWDDPGGH